MAKRGKKGVKGAVAGMAPHRQQLLLLTVVPMVAGLFLFISSWAGWVVVGTAEEQAVIGALVMLLGFAASNAVQKTWTLAAGWVLLGVAIWLMVTPPSPALRYLGMTFGVGGIVLILVEFTRRYQAREDRRD